LRPAWIAPPALLRRSDFPENTGRKQTQTLLQCDIGGYGPRASRDRRKDPTSAEIEIGAMRQFQFPE
jgi:hypothetical protein